VQQCTFRPKTNQTQRHRDKSVFEELYGDKEHHRDKLVRNAEKKRDEIEFEK
jgi:hypothetical protein